MDVPRSCMWCDVTYCVCTERINLLNFTDDERINNVVAALVCRAIGQTTVASVVLRSENDVFFGWAQLLKSFFPKLLFK